MAVACSGRGRDAASGLGTEWVSSKLLSSKLLEAKVVGVLEVLRTVGVLEAVEAGSKPEEISGCPQSSVLKVPAE